MIILLLPISMLFIIIFLSTRSSRNRKKGYKIKQKLEGRIVRLSPKFRKENHLQDKYARIETVDRLNKKNKIVKISVEVLPTEKTLSEAKKKYDKEFELQKKRYKVELENYNKRREYQNGI